MNTIDVPPKHIVASQARLRAWVIYQLSLRGQSLAAVARNNGVTKSAAYNAFLWPYPKMERAIAAALGLHPKDLWPDRYDENGQPNRRMGRPVRRKAA